MAQTRSFACLFGCSLLVRPLRLGSQQVGSPCSVVSLVILIDGSVVTQYHRPMDYATRGERIALGHTPPCTYMHAFGCHNTL